MWYFYPFPFTANSRQRPNISADIHPPLHFDGFYSLFAYFYDPWLFFSNVLTLANTPGDIRKVKRKEKKKGKKKKGKTDLIRKW